MWWSSEVVAFYVVIYLQDCVQCLVISYFIRITIVDLVTTLCF